MEVQEGQKTNWKWISLVGLAAIVLYRFYVIWWQFRLFNFLVPPSPDLAAHLEMTDGFIDGAAKIGTYPPLLHYISALFAKLFNATSLDVFNFLAPLWIPLAVVAFYFLVVKLFDYRVAFWSTLVFGFVSSNPLLNFADAQYADILGYNLLGPFYIVVLVSLIKEFKYWKLAILFLIFGLFLTAHNLSSVLLYIVSLLSIIVYCFVSYKRDRRQFKNAFYTLIALCVGTILFLSLSKLLFGPIVTKVMGSLLSGSKAISDNTSAVLDYGLLHTLLVPFLEFVGMAGVGFLFMRISNDKTRFPSLFVVVWILVLWAFSRSEFFVLPQRIFREISLPLSIAAGIFAADTLSSFKNNWLKIVFMTLFMYLVAINNTQITSSPFKLPAGFKEQIWFYQVDQEKYDYITASIKPEDRLLVNQSNPILLYKLKRAGHNLVPLRNIKDKNDIVRAEREEKFKQDMLKSLIKGSNAKYVLIGQAPPGVETEVYFQQFKNYKETIGLLNGYAYKEENLIKQFSDGSKLILIK